MLCSLKPNSLLKLEASIMAAAYAALMSLLNTSELILHPSQHWLRINIIQIESLLQKVRLLQEFLEDYSHRDHQEMAGVESQIADMAYEAEDVIECYVLAQIPARSTGSEVKYSTAFSQCIHKVIEEMEDLIKNKLMRIKESIGKFEEDPTFIDFSPAVSSRSAPSEQNTMVGSDEKLEEILDILTGQQSNRQIVAIVGMGGIGKTTLAKNVYEHPYIKNHFHICAWATISQKYSARNIIYEMLSEFGQSRSESHLSDDHELGLAKCDTGEEQLGEQLYKSLYGRRYLIVLDDLWSIEAWDEIKRFFPDHCNNGCRIMITTREKKVAAQLSSCRPFEMDLLDDNSSWELMREKVFGHQQGCRPELEELGKTIAKNCNGLPLAIVVIGGLLAKSDKTMNSWKHVAGNMKSIINSEDNEKCQKILYLSYKNLPIHLKPCFLYLAVARQPYNIDIPTLIKVWVSEGFVKPIRGKSLEEAADEYITDLVDRNLFILPRRGVLGNLLRCGVHDLLIDLCWREIEKIDLFRVIFDQNPKFMFQLRIHPSPLKPELGSVPRALGILGPASLSASDSTLLYAVQLQLLRVLIMTDSILPDENSQLMNLRFLSFHGHLDGNSILRLPWEDMSIVGSLPNLELLQLWFHACKGQTWCPTQGQFVKLKVLDIAQTDLVHWRADKTHFPVLEHLVLRYLNLEEFPQNFGEHPTLAKIEVFDCSDSTKAWAEQVGEEQENFGNEVFRVIIPEREENKTTIITSVGGYTLSQGIFPSLPFLVLITLTTKYVDIITYLNE
ncbi:putative late blight resistance protein homolog R1B-8 isoform X2 [Henckelia pumila]|uniref:putative late blight resistance protein homolog R1B-8 isoform X2 n=1 Tax=Henckelia pumila TaxID=405737 RepID=UPI003C6E0202